MRTLPSTGSKRSAGPCSSTPRGIAPRGDIPERWPSVLDSVRPSVKLPIAPLRDDPDLPCVGILSDIGIGVCRNDQDPHNVIGLVPDLMGATRPTRQGNNISFTELPVAVVQTHNRRSPQNNE